MNMWNCVFMLPIIRIASENQWALLDYTTIIITTRISLPWCQQRRQWYLKKRIKIDDVDIFCNKYITRYISGSPQLFLLCPGDGILKFKCTCCWVSAQRPCGTYVEFNKDSKDVHIFDFWLQESRDLDLEDLSGYYVLVWYLKAFQDEISQCYWRIE